MRHWCPSPLPSGDSVTLTGPGCLQTGSFPACGRHSFDLVVLGAGSGGLAAAKRAARHGARVAIVEGDRVGGTCVIRGCVPKKLLVYGAQARHQLADAPAYGLSIGSVQSDVPELFRRVRAEVDRPISSTLVSSRKPV